MNEGIAALVALTRQGWTFVYPTDENGEITKGLGARFYPGAWWDGLVIFDEDECEAIRVNPDDEVTWKRCGNVLDMAQEVSTLPPPGNRLAPNLSQGWHMREGLWRLQR
ncbi:hypothetical protein [Actinokineospora sp. NPDC004072]